MNKKDIKAALKQGKRVIVQYADGSTKFVFDARKRGPYLLVLCGTMDDRAMAVYRTVYEGEVTIEGTPSEAYKSHSEQHCNHAYEQMLDGSAQCFECAHKLTAEQWQVWQNEHQLLFGE